METGGCMYCGRTPALSELLEKGGKYRCKNDADCLEFQIRTHSPDAPDDPSAPVKAALAEAAGRLAAYGTGPEHVERSADAPAECGWMKAALDLLAAEYREKTEFRFQADGKGGHAIAFQAADGSGTFKAAVAPLTPSGYALIVARTADSVADGEDLYREFIYKSYPEERRETLLEDLAVVLLAFAGAGERRVALLGRLRREIEARSWGKGGH